MLTEQLDVLLTGGTKAIKEIVCVSLGELGGVTEGGTVVVDVVMLLDGLNNVALALKLEELLGHHDVSVIDGDAEVAEITLVLIQVSWVTIGTLVVRNGPGGSCHHAQVVVSVGVNGVHQCHLSECHSLNYKNEAGTVRLIFCLVKC